MPIRQPPGTVLKCHSSIQVVLMKVISPKNKIINNKIKWTSQKSYRRIETYLQYRTMIITISYIKYGTTISSLMEVLRNHARVEPWIKILYNWNNYILKVISEWYNCQFFGLNSEISKLYHRKAKKVYLQLIPTIPKVLQKFIFTYVQPTHAV